MNRRIRVTAIKKEQPDIGLYVLALIALARQLEEAERPTAGDGAPSPEPSDAEQEVSHEGA